MSPTFITIDSLASVHDRANLFHTLRISKKSTIYQAKKFLEYFTKEIDEGNYDYFSKNKRLLGIEAIYPDNDRWTLRSREIKEPTHIIDIMNSFEGNVYHFLYDATNKPSEMDSIKEVLHKITDYDPQDLISIQFIRSGQLWLLMQNQIRVPSETSREIIQKDDEQYVLQYKVRR